jgi:hypothetical protein
VAKDTLYALCIPGTSITSSRIYKFDGDKWTSVENPTGYNKLQSIYGAGDYLFVGAARGDISYAILYTGGTGGLSRLSTGDTSELRGAAYLNSKYYLATRGSGIYRLDSPSSDATIISGTESAGNFVGLLPIPAESPTSVIYGFTSNGTIGKVLPGSGSSDESWEKIQDHRNTIFTSALGIWSPPPPPGATESPSGPSLLLIGRGDRSNTGISYTYGYYELNISSGDLGGSLENPGQGNPSSVLKYEQYLASLGRYPLNGIYQVPWEIDKTMPIFASAEQKGLWSYRDDVWNAED